jgi:4-diphosphocytidyl-2-C-methyl-D-erythritol kinase
LTKSLSVESPAKINLFLEVLGKRPDGYHELETVMTRVSLTDQLSFSVVDSGISLGVSALDVVDFSELPPMSENLIVKTLRRLQDHSGCRLGMQVELVKRIPIKAGLGGASSNAATALMAANHLWGLGLTTEQLARVANELGSDITYFLYEGTALCCGRGEQVQPLKSTCGWPVVLVQPPFGLSTADVFRTVKIPTRPLASAALVEELKSGSALGLSNCLFNRLEESAMEHNEWFRAARQLFREAGAVAAQMTGSGSCFFGIFANLEMAQTAAKMIGGRQPNCRVFCCQTVREGFSIGGNQSIRTVGTIGRT